MISSTMKMSQAIDCIQARYCWETLRNVRISHLTSWYSVHQMRFSRHPVLLSARSCLSLIDPTSQHRQTFKRDRSLIICKYNNQVLRIAIAHILVHGLEAWNTF